MKIKCWNPWYVDPKNAHFGDEIKGYTEKIDISGYTFVKAEDLKVGTDNEKNIVKRILQQRW